MHEQVSYVLDAWMNVCVEAGNTDRASYERQCAQFLQSLQGHTTEQFFSAMIESVLSARRRSFEVRDAKRREVRISDAFARLVVLLLKQGSPHGDSSHTLQDCDGTDCESLLSHYDAQRALRVDCETGINESTFASLLRFCRNFETDPQLPNGGGMPVRSVRARSANF